MNGINPKWGAYLGLLVIIEQGIGHGTVSLTNLIPMDWAPYVTSWANFLAFIGTSIMTYQAAVSGPQAGPLANTPLAPAAKVVILLAVLLASLFAFQGDASAQKLTGNLVRDIAAAQGKPTPATAAPAGSVDGAIQSFSEGVQKIEKALVDKGIADLTAAITDATNHNDNISLPCWNANLKLLQSLPSQWETPPPSPIGIALGIQIQRDLLNAITGSDASSLKVACAALWGDQLKIVANLGALIGVRIATGGLF